MSLIERHASHKILNLLQVFPAVLIIGARQTGKTSLCKSMFANWDYFDLELESESSLLRANPELFFRQYNSRVILDEAQESPAVFRNLRSVIDADRGTKGRFVITGSSSPTLMKEAADSLAGRVGIVELGTLTISERLALPVSPFFRTFLASSAHEQKENLLALTTRFTFPQLTSFLARGGYPEPALFSNAEHWKAWMSNYVRTFIDRDIRKLFPQLDTIRFSRFIRLLGSINAKIINKADIAAAIGVSEPVVTDYVDIAHKTFLWRTIPHFHRNIIKSIIKSPKGIVRDSGLGSYFLGHNSEEQLLNSVAVGLSFESFVIEELAKGFGYALMDDVALSHFRTRAGSEVDIILEGSFGMIPIEIKFGSHTKLGELTGLGNFIKRHNLPYGMVINNSTRVQLLSEKILQIPIGVI